MPCCQPAQYQHSEFLASWAGQQQQQHPCGTPAASCLVQQQSALLHFPHLQAPPAVAAQACPSSMMGVAMSMCARSLGSTMQALQAASLLCEACPEAAATDSALCRAEQLMAETINKVRLTLRLAVFLKQQQQQQQQPWVCFGEAAAVLPAAAAGAAAKVAAANMAAAEQCDPSIADSACSGYAGLPRAPPQLMLSYKWVGSTQMQVHQQQQQQQQQEDAVQSAQQDIVQSAQQDAGLQEEVGSSWE
uniref:Uncharacterized protein n=1 Tax=Tetradesmus obliquus TaxID=3088 RepID=A0A383W2V0_TETOB|eukprot:jgi/Sobl393_1/9901/SZX71493.1